MNILLVGASVRAAAASIQRAGGRSVAFDLYRDLDLAAIADATRLIPADYPTKVWDRVRHLPPLPWLYTGAIENHPDVVAALSRRFRLLGNGPAVLRLVRDPFRLAEMVRGAGLSAPAVRSSPARLPTDGSWLAKPIRSGGGEGISPWVGATAPDRDEVYYQARVEGLPLAATFVRDGSATRLMGITRQYLGRVGNRFAYRGSLGPWPVGEAVHREIDRLGQFVGASFGLVGLFGIDLIDAGGRVWLIEVNPRYTASVEVLEASLGRSIMAEHLQACDPRADLALKPVPAVPASRCAAKAILFARSKGALTEAIHPGPTAATSWPEVADIPAAGTSFEAGHPVLTVFGRGDTVATCRADLARRLRAWLGRIEVAR